HPSHSESLTPPLRNQSIPRPAYSRRAVFAVPPRRPPPAPTLFLPENDHHEQRVLGALEDLVRLEAEEPLDELEAAGQLDQRPQLLRKDHPRAVDLAVDTAG